jgi:hydroxymethylpyrimidine kinase/phosphomethylpyrimidine kinase
MKPPKQPAVLSIAGYDPSGGAGVLMDAKVFNSLEIIGLCVSTSITYQNDIYFDNVDWLSEESIKQQIDVLHQRFDVGFVKIGLIENFDTLNNIINYLVELNPDVKIIWDTIIKSSSGYNFHTIENRFLLEDILTKIFIITPNMMEVSTLGGIDYLTKLTNVFWKGGHPTNDNNDPTNILDILYLKGNLGTPIILNKEKINSDKHGTGCILSAALCVYLSQNITIELACKLATNFTSKAIASHEGLLALV